jgi:hypothetical protein
VNILEAAVKLLQEFKECLINDFPHIAKSLLLLIRDIGNIHVIMLTFE